MKYFIYFLVCFLTLSATQSFAQKRMVENAIKDAVLIPAKGDTTNGKRPCAVFNRSLRTITVRVEESIEISNYLEKRIIVYSKLAPHEKRFVGAAGCDHFLMEENCRAYKVVLAYYEDTAPSAVASSKPASAAAAVETESGSAAAAGGK